MELSEIVLVLGVVIIICLLIYILYLFKRKEVREESVFTMTVDDHHNFKAGDRLRYEIPSHMATLEIVEINGNDLTLKKVDDGNNSSRL